MTDEWLTIGHAADYLGIHRNTLRRWGDRGLVPTYRVGARGDRRYRRSELDRFLRAIRSGTIAVDTEVDVR